MKRTDIACKIRAYINALEPKVDMNDEKPAEWIEWAKKRLIGLIQQKRGR